MVQLALIPEQTGLIATRQIVLPFVPPSKNKWASYQPMWMAGLRDKWKKALKTQFEIQQVPMFATRVACEAKLWFASANRRDFQNYMYPLWHWVADALVEYGAIRDDTPDYFSIGPNGGLVFMVDRRKYVNERDKRRTVIGMAFELYGEEEIK